MKENLEFDRNTPQPYETDTKKYMRDTGTTGDDNLDPFQH